MTILEMSFYGGVMILAVVLLRALTVHRLPKRTFVVLWLLTLARLLLPFTIPSPASVYTLAGEHNHVLPIQIPTPRPAATAPVFSQVNAPAFGQGAAPVAGNAVLPAATTPVGQVAPGAVPSVTSPTGTVPAPTPAVPVWTLVWLVGLTACALFFLVVYVKNQREFRMSLPVENDFLTAWLEDHPLRRRIRVRQYDRITAPLTYGLVRPVILLPADTDWGSGEELSYVLEHELIHIKRWDGLTKLLLAAAVCVHWFNPLVWLMFFLANRDLELSCDEGVLRRFGTRRRGEYARTLIGMEETRGGLTPIYNHFSKSAIEERVVAIMKTKKLSVAAVIAAVVLVAAVAVMFATSPREEPKEVWVPTLRAEEISEVTWSGELLTGAPACPEAAEAARLINAAAQNEVDSETLPNGRHGYVFADMHVRRGGEEEVYVSVGTVKDIVCISVGERSGYFEAPELYQRIASQNDTPDNVDQEALELYQDAIRAYLISTMPGNSNIDRITIDEHADLPAGSVRGYGTVDGETIVFRQDLTRLSLVQENPDWNAQLWAIGEALSTDPVDKIGQFMGNSYLDSQFRRHGMGSGVDRLVTANGEALGFLNQEWPELEEGLDHYDSLEELKADLTEIPSELLDEHDSEPTLEALAGEYHFLSGAGGWETVLYIKNSETSNNELFLSGRYYDSEMGERDPELYPNGTVYRCSFTGSLTIPQKVDEYTYSMRLNGLYYDTPGLEFYGGRLRPEGWQFSLDPSENGQGAETDLPSIEQYFSSGSWGKWDSKTRYVTSTPYGLDEAEEILIYLPGTPVSSLPQEALSWLTSAPGFGDPENRPETLPFTVLYNVKEGNAFFQGSTPDEAGAFEALAGKYRFLSGAGGWQTFLKVNADGTFYGQYHDSEMGEYEPVKYPKGTVYLCNFDGAFDSLERVDQYTYTMRLGWLDYVPAGRELVVGEDGSIDEEAYQGFTQGEIAILAVNENDDWWLINMRGTEYAYTQGTDSSYVITEGKLHSMLQLDTGTRYITSTPYGLDEAKEITVYLPGTPVSSLPQEALSWLTSAPGFGDPENRPETLPFTVLYNVAEGEAFFQDNSLTQGGETLVPLGEAVAGLDLSWRQEGESLFLNDGAVEIELRSGDYYVYRRGYVTDVLQNPMVLREGVPHLPISFCNQYLSEGGDLCHAVKYFFKDEIRDALNDPTASASRRVLAAVSLPRSMGIET
ncbi:MAG: hypothetical protein J6J87_02310, partial [Oscillospiraceae bacterium]|nr:hypothetical protein [Oscillospiraceae bacterium]